jgi:hypothetical protein
MTTKEASHRSNLFSILLAVASISLMCWISPSTRPTFEGLKVNWAGVVS